MKKSQISFSKNVIARPDLSGVAQAKSEALCEEGAKEDDNGFSLFTFFAFPDNLYYNMRDSCYVASRQRRSYYAE